MSKIYKATVYIDDINDELSCNLVAIERILEEEGIYLTIDLDTKEKKDTTEYIKKVGDDYSWNTTDRHKRIIEMEKFLYKGSGSNE